ncbi:ADP-ribosylglycohydrolase family protein [Streptomyces boninensis]|uniref:ADP-ribosylglycohydrolase family protein n=1 Tax=Streptomyces boninensis TaxID=2039455 RepID=UPI003B2218F0
MNRRPATGALLGLALGDALGYPTEFSKVSTIEADHGPWRKLPLPDPAIVSDDTQMTLALARGLRAAMARGYLAPKRLVRPVREEFVEWSRSPANNRAPGHTCMAACRILAQEQRPWSDAAQMESKGCGANMRVAPIALAPGLSDEQRSGAAQLQAVLTHGHPTALAASDLTAYAVRSLAEGAEPGELIGLLRAYAEDSRRRYRDVWLGDFWRAAPLRSGADFIEMGWEDCLKALGWLEGAVRHADVERDPCTYTGEGWVAEETLVTGLLCFLLVPGEPVLALRRAACSSGDSDSIACLTGAFAGAYYGAAAWPEEWVRRVEHREELMGLGEEWDTGRAVAPATTPSPTPP